MRFLIRRLTMPHSGQLRNLGSMLNPPPPKKKQSKIAAYPIRILYNPPGFYQMRSQPYALENFAFHSDA